MTAKTVFIIPIFFMNLHCFPHSANEDINKDSISDSFIVQFDLTVTRIPKSSLPIGISWISNNGKTLQTKGFLQGTVSWREFKVDVEGGAFKNGKIEITNSETYQRAESLVVRVYLRETEKLICIQKIPFNYEVKIKAFTSNIFERIPGQVAKFIMRTYYDNGTYTDSDPASIEKPFIIFPYCSYISHGNLIIDNDPFKIKNHTAGLIARLAKNPLIADTLRIILDYVHHYNYSGEGGHDLNVYASVYFDTLINTKLMSVKVNDSATNQSSHYLINTQGGSVEISSRGTNGYSGRDGFDGSNGLSGSDGIWTTKTVVNLDGTITTTPEQGRGRDGSNGSNGEDGGNGGNGGDGGDINIHVTSSAQPYLHMIKASSIPGSGGSGGRGGRGGSGGSGGSPGGSSGSSGLSGSEGSSGSAGRAGKINIIIN